LAGAFTFIWAAAVLHVLSKAECASFVTNTHSLLSEGGSLYGWTLGAKQAGASGKTPDGKQARWAHSLVSALYLYFHSGIWATIVSQADQCFILGFAATVVSMLLELSDPSNKLVLHLK